MTRPPLKSLQDICEQAMSTGQIIDLKGCFYGPWHSQEGFNVNPENYYFFLAGLVRSQKWTHILEIGTHWGGSILAMNKGLCGEETQKDKLVTVDITNNNEKALKGYPHIIRIQGDALSKATIRKVFNNFTRDIDFLYIDSIHEYGHVAACIANYANKLHPKYIVLHDIHINESMKKIWSRLQEDFKDTAFDATEISRSEKAVGLGIIAWGPSSKWKWTYKDTPDRMINFMKQVLPDFIKRFAVSILKIKK